MTRNSPATGLRISTLILLVFLALPFTAKTQEFEVGLLGGGTYYLGDLNPGGHFKNMGVAFGLLARYNLSDRWAVRITGFRGEIKADAGSTNYMPSRGLSFTSPVTDISAIVEFNFFPYFTGSRRYPVSPYIYGGIGMTMFRPSAGGHELHPLGTEGQNDGYQGRSPYHLTQVNLPFGLGAKISVTKKLGLTVFWELHKLFTDYLDDVSTTYYLSGPAINPDDPAQYLSDPTMDHEPGWQRGNSSTKDWYACSGITLTYKFALGKGKRCRDLKGQQ